MRRNKETKFRCAGTEVFGPAPKLLKSLLFGLTMTSFWAPFVDAGVSALYQIPAIGAPVALPALAGFIGGAIGLIACSQPDPRTNRHVAKPKRLDR